MTTVKPMIPTERAVRGLAADALGLMEKCAGPVEDTIQVGQTYLRTIADHIYTPASGLAKVALAVADDPSVSARTRVQAVASALMAASAGVPGPQAGAVAQFGSDLIMDGFQTRQAALTDAGRAQADHDIQRVTRATAGVLAKSDDRIRSSVAIASLLVSGTTSQRWAAQAAAVETCRHLQAGDSMTKALRTGARQAFDFGPRDHKTAAIEPFLDAIPTRHL